MGPDKLLVCKQVYGDEPECGHGRSHIRVGSGS